VPSVAAAVAQAAALLLELRAAVENNMVCLIRLTHPTFFSHSILWEIVKVQLNMLSWACVRCPLAVLCCCRRLAVNRFVSIFGLEWGRECWLGEWSSQ
jgi:hypothetical protein